VVTTTGTGTALARSRTVLLCRHLSPRRPAGFRRLSKARTSPRTSRVRRRNLKDQLRPPTPEVSAAAGARRHLPQLPLPHPLTPLPGGPQPPLSLLPAVL
jgi:hypothetical protein